MSADNLIITIFAKDRPGIVQAISDAVLAYQGNWLDSSLSRLCGQFAGIVHIALDSARHDELRVALDALQEQGIRVTVQNASVLEADDDEIESIQILVEAPDRPGIVEEISSALSDVNVNVEHMDTECTSDSVAGYNIFNAHLSLALPDGFGEAELQEVFETVSADLTVSVLQD